MRPARSAADAERGLSLVELLVTMFCLAAVMTIVYMVITLSYNAEARVSNTSRANNEIVTAFMRLDGEIRYAADINQPGQDSNKNYWVEYESDWPSTGPKCNQLEYDNTNGVLQERSWPLTGSPSANWQPLASGLQTSVGTDPFSLATPGTSLWQLTVTLKSTYGSGPVAESTHSSFTITALDISGNSSSTNVCGGNPS
jgi:type II secretory pathway pseudopilin PulG